MGLVSRIIVAAIAGLFGVMMIAIAPPTDTGIFFYGFGVFCLAIAVACVSRGRVTQFCGSLVGITVFALGLWYIGSMFFDGPLWSGRKSEASLINALLFMGGFGVPGAVYVYHARFGFHNRRAALDSPPNETRQNDGP